MSQDQARGNFEELCSFLRRMNDRNMSEMGVDLILARESETDGPVYDFKVVPVEGEIARELVELVHDKITQKYKDVQTGDVQFDRYQLQNQDRDREYLQYESADEIPRFNHFERLLSSELFEETTYLEPPKPDFQAIRIRDQRNEEMALAFINYTQHQILGRTSRIRMWAVDDEVHRQVSESILSIPNRIDAAYYDDITYIVNQSGFEKVFDYTEEYERRAEEVINAIERNGILFENFDLFEEAIYGNDRALRLMYKVHECDAYSDLDQISMEEIRDSFDTDVEFVESSSGDIMIHMDDKRDIWAVLRFLNDDHLNSPITDGSYISISKQNAG